MQAYTGELVQAAYLEHRGGLIRHLTLVTRDGEVAQDLAHETFIRLAHEIEAGRAPDDTAAWLHRVGRNLATSRGRHLQVEKRHAELPKLRQRFDNENVPPRIREADRVEHADVCLGDAHRRVALARLRRDGLRDERVK